MSDGEGRERDGMAAARQHAMTQVRELKLAMCDPHIQDLSGWTMSAANADGRTVFKIGFDFKGFAEL